MFFCSMSCHLCFSRFLSNILQSPEALESINPDRWVFYGARRYICSRTQAHCRVHIQTNWWDGFVAYKWCQFASPADASGCLHVTVCVWVHQKSLNLDVTHSIFFIIKPCHFVYGVLMFILFFLSSSFIFAFVPLSSFQFLRDQTTHR